MSSSREGPSVAQLLRHAREQALEETLSALSPEEWAAFATFPAWTHDALNTSEPNEGRIRAAFERAVTQGIVRVERSTVLLRSPDGAALQRHGTMLSLEPHLRALALGDLPDRELTPIAHRMARRLLHARIPLPFPTWRVAELAAHEDPTSALRDRIGAALPDRFGDTAFEGGNADEALAWVRAARHLAEFLSTKDRSSLLLAAELAGRSIDLYHRRRDDLEFDLEFVPIGRPLDEVNAFLDAADGPWGLHVLGQGGVGKTMLLRHVLIERARRSNWTVARIDFDFIDPSFPRREPWLLLIAIVAELRLQAQSAADTSLFGRLQDGIAALREKATLAAGDPFEHPLFREVATLLGGAVGDRRLLVVLDTCEELERLGGVTEGHDAIMAMFKTLEAIRAHVRHLRVLIGGRRPLAAAGPGWRAGVTPFPSREWLSAIEILGFPADAAAAVLSREGARSGRPDWAEVAAAIQKRATLQELTPRLEGPARGRDAYVSPYELSLLARWAAADASLTAADLLATDGDIYVERRILPRLHRALRTVLPGLVACGTFDRELVLALSAGPDGDLAWREAARQEWVSGGDWISIRPVFRQRLDDVFRKGSGSASAQCDRLAAVARQHLRERIDASPVAASPSAVEAWARGGRSDEDVECWTRWEAEAAQKSAWDWIERVTGALLANGGPVSAEAAHPLRLPLLKSRIRAIAELRPGLRPETEQLWADVETEAARQTPASEADIACARWHLLALRIAGRPSEPSAMLAIKRALDAFGVTPSRMQQVPGSIPAFVSLAISALGEGYALETDREIVTEFEDLLVRPALPLREELAALAIRLAPPDLRGQVAERWVQTACAEPTEHPPWDWPWRGERHASRLIELIESLWPTCVPPATVREWLSAPVRAVLGHENDETERLSTLWLGLAAADRPTAVDHRPPMSPEQSSWSHGPDVETSIPYRELATIRELATLGWFEEALDRGATLLDSATRMQRANAQYSTERILADVFTMARSELGARVHLRNLEDSRLLDDRLDAAFMSWVCGGKHGLKSHEGLNPIVSLRLGWQTADWSQSRAAAALLRDFREDERPPDVLLALVALVEGVGNQQREQPELLAPGGELSPALHLALYEGLMALQDAGLEVPSFQPPFSHLVIRDVVRHADEQPKLAVRVAGRAFALLGTSLSLVRAASQRLGCRTAAWQLRKEGERLALRVPSAGARLLQVAADGFGACDDVVGRLTSAILAVLAKRRCRVGAGPEDAWELIRLWNELAAASTRSLPDVFGRLAHDARGFVRIPEWRKGIAGDYPGRGDEGDLGWGGWAARMTAALGDGVPEHCKVELSTEGPSPPLSEHALRATAQTTLELLDGVDVPWLRESLANARGSSRSGLVRGLKSPRTVIDSTSIRVNASGETVRIGARSDGEWVDLWNGPPMAVQQVRALLTEPPKRLYVDEESAEEPWEELLDAPDAERYCIDQRPRAARFLDERALVVSDDWQSARTVRGLMWPNADIVGWRELRFEGKGSRVLHLITNPTQGSRGVLLGPDVSMFSNVRGDSETGASVLIAPERLFDPRMAPDVVVLQLPMYSDPEGGYRHLRHAAFELCRMGAGVVIVLPATSEEHFHRWLSTSAVEQSLPFETGEIRRQIAAMRRGFRKLGWDDLARNITVHVSDAE